ncbi:MAG TPA: pyruvate, phosphate dikinase [Longimicrobiales bacterium]|nr:pyruvate, phosphate dikinase [Longimicrobiales bacterium]
MSVPGRWIYHFGDGVADGGRGDADLLGGKGANLAEMVSIGVPVPPGFTITTEACRAYLAHGALPDGLEAEVDEHLALLERQTGRTFGSGPDPLLVSVRSGAAASMPGMMDTILNLGLNQDTVVALAGAARDERFAWDAYRRFVQMHADVVLGVPARAFEERLRAGRERLGVATDADLTAVELRSITEDFFAIVAAATGCEFPADPRGQLTLAIEAVFGSWNTERARSYRRVARIPEHLGTAVSVVAMVFGNLGATSGTGVAFTRNPATGERRLFGEFLVNAQGEDVVAGTRDPLALDAMADALPEAYGELRRVAESLERHYGDVQDIEFTVERGRLYLLQTRTAKRTAAAAVRAAVEMVDEGVLEEADALLRVDPDQLDQLLHPRLDPAAEARPLATGLPASPGAVAGRIVVTAESAVEWAARGEQVILVREETSPEDFDGMVAARGILTARGGMTSHAAVVARGLGLCCVAGASSVRTREDPRSVSVGEHEFSEGDWITLDGSTGEIFAGRVPTTDPEPSEHFDRLMAWADRERRLGVRANADTPADAIRARAFGAEGIGLCRTEHMFFEGERIDTVREMILAPDDGARQRALDRLLPMQREDFAGIFRAMDGLPVTVRLLDPPLHEFLPGAPEEVDALAQRLGRDPVELRGRLGRLRESNPMLGHRGVRLGTTFPAISRMQARALFEAAVDAVGKGVSVRPEVMIPLVAIAEEYTRQMTLVRDVAESVMQASGVRIDYLVGTMIELPRAALTAGRIAADADFFSFGTNDLTQTTFGLSRDDAGSFLPFYVEQGLLEHDPFRTIDLEGVGELVCIAVERGRAARPGLKLGVCGEHGGDPRSIDFFHRTGLDYVSCSPFRVPAARLAAARASLGDRTRPVSQG